MDWNKLWGLIQLCDVNGVAKFADANDETSMLHCIARMPPPPYAGDSEILTVRAFLQSASAPYSGEEWDGEVNYKARYARSTPLHYACYAAVCGQGDNSWHLAVIKALLDSGADIDETNRDNDTPLSHAIRCSEGNPSENRSACVSLLLNRRANPNHAKAALGGQFPPWMEELMQRRQQRESTSKAATTLIGIRRNRQSIMNRNADKGVVHWIAELMMADCYNPAWINKEPK